MTIGIEPESSVVRSDQSVICWAITTGLAVNCLIFAHAQFCSKEIEEGKLAGFEPITVPYVFQLANPSLLMFF